MPNNADPGHPKRSGRGTGPLEQPQAVEPAMAPSQNTTTSQATNFNIDSFPLLYLEVQIND